MLIAYVTTDEVNEQLALQMAEDSGETLCPLSPCDAPPDEDFDAVVYDWDYLPAQLQQAILVKLLADETPWPAALHGYNIDQGTVRALRKQNVAVHRTMQAKIFRQMARRGASGRTDRAAGDAIYTLISNA